MHTYTDIAAHAVHRDRAASLQREAAADRLARQADGRTNRRLRRRGKRAAAPSVPRQRSAGERSRVSAPGPQAA